MTSKDKSAMSLIQNDSLKEFRKKACEKVLSITFSSGSNEACEKLQIPYKGEDKGNIYPFKRGEFESLNIKENK